ncbi:hypothetical protein A3731_11245 [Roseovarius sp. HI0049]|nr:hypothetical protein A3731_11245 [Roseovarius sp. HI0049]
MRAVWRAGRWLSNPESRTTAGEILSRAQYLDVPSELIDRALSGHLTVSGRGEQRQVEGFLEFHRGAATFPWRSQAKWIAGQMARSHGLDLAAMPGDLAAAFRSDLYRRHLSGTSNDLPGASEKVEGAIRHETPVASAQGRLSLRPDRFFDGRIFDPNEAG